jgi:hypothetical protein
VAGWGQVRAEKQAMDGSHPHGGHRYISEGDTALFRGEEGDPLDGRDQTIVDTVAVSLSLCRRGFQDLLRSGHRLC